MFFWPPESKKIKGWMNANAWTERHEFLMGFDWRHFAVASVKTQGSTKKFTFPFSRRVTWARFKTRVDLGKWMYPP